MSELTSIQKSDQPRTRASLACDLRKLGLVPGMNVLVHSSLGSLGWVCGGEVTVIKALLDVVTHSGTVMVPTFSGDYSDPADWSHPPVPPDWIPIIKATMPAFQSDITPTRNVGTIPEVFRKYPGVFRSSHPAVSFAALGNYARFLTENHKLEYSLGEGSPLARLYELDGCVLMLGTEYHTNTSFHLAEVRTPGIVHKTNGAPLLVNGETIWKEFEDFDYDTDSFPDIGRDFEQRCPVKYGTVGSANCRLFRQRVAVDFAVEWLKGTSDQ